MLDNVRLDAITLLDKLYNHTTASLRHAEERHAAKEERDNLIKKKRSLEYIIQLVDSAER